MEFLNKLVDAGILRPSTILILEAALCCGILVLVPYTEIDWIAYMQEVKGYIDGELDYTKLKGDTGPLVYPAAFVYIYAALYYITNLGKHIFLAQCIFGLFYLFTQSTVMKMYVNSGIHPVWLLTLIFSKRIHSIFLLRMFNDGVAIMLAYFGFYLVSTGYGGKRRWFVGCFFYSLAVGVKMNIFLFAPGLLYVMLRNHSVIKTGMLLGLCALVQVVVAAPFLAHNWVSYLKKAFELDRVFTYKWTVNFKFLPEEIFVDKRLGYALLAATALTWLLLALTRWRKRDLTTTKGMLMTVFESNMVGLIFTRTMHYQFYSWFYHQLPFVLICSAPKLPAPMKVWVMVFVEYGFNTYPSNVRSSAFLMVAMAVTWVCIVFSKDEDDTLLPAHREQRNGKEGAGDQKKEGTAAALKAKKQQ